MADLEKENQALKRELALLRSQISPIKSSFSPVPSQTHRPAKSSISLSSHVPGLRKLILESSETKDGARQFDTSMANTSLKLGSLSNVDYSNLSTTKSLLKTPRQDNSTLNELESIRSRLDRVASSLKDDSRIQQEFSAINTSIESLKHCITDAVPQDTPPDTPPVPSLASAMERVRSRYSLMLRRRKSSRSSSAGRRAHEAKPNKFAVYGPGRRNTSLSRSKSPLKRDRSSSMKRREVLQIPQMTVKKDKQSPRKKKLCDDCIFLLHRGFSTLHCCRHLVT